MPLRDPHPLVSSALSMAVASTVGFHFVLIKHTSDEKKKYALWINVRVYVFSYNTRAFVHTYVYACVCVLTFLYTPERGKEKNEN